MVETTRIVADDLISSSKPKKIQGVPYFLPKTVLKVAISGAYAKPSDPKPEEYALTMKILGTENVADPNHLYLANINTTWGTDDEIKIEVNEKGLLQEVKAISDDRTDDIVKEGAKLAAKVLSTVATGGAVPAKAPNNCEAKDLRAFSIEQLVNIHDFFDKKGQSYLELEKAVFEAMTANSDARSEFTNERVAIKFGAERLGTRIPNATPESVADMPGLRMRLPRSISYDLELDPSSYWCNLRAGSIAFRGEEALIMDPNAEYLLDLDRTPLVRKSVAMINKDGAYSVDVNEPSTALAFASLPLELINILLSPIARLIHGDPSADAPK